MNLLFSILLMLASLGIIVIILLQSGKSAGLSGAITGGAEQLFGKQKARGIDKVLHRTTVVLSVIFFVSAFLLAFFI